MSASNSVTQSLALAKTPSTLLGLTVGKHTPTKGTYIPRADAQSPPSLSFEGAQESKTYLAVCLDLDAPFKSFAFLSPILHWIQPGFKRESSVSPALESFAPVITNYAPPGPPPGAGPHRYVFMLYEQPETFDAAKSAAQDAIEGLRARMRFDWDAWERKAGLGKPVAANFFTSN